MTRLWMIGCVVVLGGCRVHVMAEGPPPRVVHAPAPAPEVPPPPPPASELRAKEIKADRVYARLIVCKEIHARGGRVGVQSGPGKHEGWGDEEIRAEEVRAEIIHAKEIHADWIEAEEVRCKEVKIGRRRGGRDD